MPPFSAPYLNESHRKRCEEAEARSKSPSSEQPPMSPAEFTAQVKRLRGQSTDGHSKSVSTEKLPPSASGPNEKG